MRKLVGAILLALPLAAGAMLPAIGPAFTEELADPAEALDTLFAQLRVAPDPASAQAIDAQIWTIWTTPQDPDLASRMSEILDARISGNLASAITLLDELVFDFPDYAEGWNQRATLYYMTGDFEHSIADCARVLELEPRHFGALAGRALMYLQLGRRALALKDMAAALAIHPFLSEAALFPELNRAMTHV